MRYLFLLVVLLLTACAMPAAAVTEHCPDGWTSKDESGDDGALVLAAGTVFCVKGGTQATGILTADGVTSLAAYLTAAGIEGGESYFAVYPPPSPTPSPSPSPSSSAPPSPSPSASVPPTATLFSVSTCPATGEPLAANSSRIRFEHPLLLLAVLNVRIDGQLITFDSVLGDGNVGDVIVSVGVHTWSISNAADTEVLAEGSIDCPECNPVSVTPPPATLPSPTPVPLLPNTATGG